MALSPFMAAIQQISTEKGIPEERVIDTVEAAIAAAYRRDYGTPGQNIRVNLKDTGGDEGITFEVHIQSGDDDTDAVIGKLSAYVNQSVIKELCFVDADYIYFRSEQQDACR